MRDRDNASFEGGNRSYADEDSSQCREDRKAAGGENTTTSGRCDQARVTLTEIVRSVDPREDRTSRDYGCRCVEASKNGLYAGPFG